MSDIGRVQNNSFITPPATSNDVNVNTGVFDGRTASQLAGSGDVFGSPISSHREIPVSSIPDSTGSKTLQDRAILQAVTARSPDEFRELAVKLKVLNSEQTMQLLLSKDNDGQTPMHHAMQNAACLQALAPHLSQLEPAKIAELLTVKDKNGITPMLWVMRAAARLQNFVSLLRELKPAQIVELLMDKYGTDHTLLQLFAIIGNAEGARLLLKLMKDAQAAIKAGAERLS